MSNYQGDIALGATITLTFNTNAAAGESATYTGGTVEVYKNADLAQSTAGVTVSKDHDGKTGAHLVSIVTSDVFYVAGDYHVMLIGATVDTKTVNAFIGSFSIANRPVQGMATSLLASIAAAVWDYATASAGAVSTFGGYILSKLGLITAGGVTFTSPVDPITGNLTLYDQDYTVDSGITRPSWSSDDWTPFDLSAAASITLSYRTKNGAETAFGTMEVVSDTEVRLATLLKTQAQALPYGRGAAGIKIVAVLSVAKGSDTVELVNEKLNHFNFRALDNA